MTNIAKLVSFLFHPVLMPLLGILIIYNAGIYQSAIPWEAKRFTYMVVFLFSVLLPLAMLSLLVYWKSVQDIQLNERRERFTPMILTATSLVALHLILFKVIPIKLINAYTLSMAIAAVIFIVINMKIKPSLHLIALGGITGLIAIISKVFMADLFLWLAILILVTGFVASSRLYLKAHTFPEIITGYVAGFACVFCTIYFSV